MPPPPPAPPAPPAAAVDDTAKQLESTHIADGGAAKSASGSGGLRGRVVWAYEAAEENELTLVEGAIISNIEQIDEGWWSGVDEHGHVGLLPSSYIELIDDDASKKKPRRLQLLLLRPHHLRR